MQLVTKKMQNNSKWILLIEDDSELQDIARDKLSEEGLQVVISSKISDGVCKLRNQKFDCILLDLVLHGGSGEQIIEILRANKKDPNFNTPILIISGKIDKKVILKQGSNIKGAFVKPVDYEELIKKINDVTSQSRVEKI